MDDIIKKMLEQQEAILERQREILNSMRRMEEELNLTKFLYHRQFEETNSRIEISERSLKQIDEQLAISNIKQEARDEQIKRLLNEFQRANQAKRLNVIEELLRLIAANQIMDSLEPPKKPRNSRPPQRK